MQRTIQPRPIPTGYSEHTLPNHWHPVVKRVLAARQVNSAHTLDYSLEHLHSFKTLTGIDAAIDLLQDALERQTRILIVADFDADGATSCAIAIKALRQMGAQNVSYLVPNREKHGYGLTPTLVDLAHESYQPDLLITVDNGISSLSAVRLAKHYGMRVLITDHHAPPLQLPNADAIVNPNQRGDVFPSKHLAGVGVIFYLLLALRARLRADAWFSRHGLPEPNCAHFLDLVALGTVADVVALDYNNRILVEQGLRRIRSDQCCPGVRALCRVAGCNQTNTVANDLAFLLAPRLNAAGRMDDMSYGIACLLSDHDTEALERAQLLNTFNEERRFVQAEMHQEAVIMLDELQQTAELPAGLCLLGQHWHPGVIGILASRVRDLVQRPVIIFTAMEDDCLRGSARSVPEVPIRDVLATIAAAQPDMITHFGGHAMAAGLTLPRQHFTVFQQLFTDAVEKQLPSDSIRGIIYSDGELAATDFTLDLAEKLRILTPWGKDFPEPVFDGHFAIIDRRMLKGKHLKMQVRPLSGGFPLETIAFNVTENGWPPLADSVKLAYKLDVNTFRGVKSVQLRAEYAEFCHST